MTSKEIMKRTLEFNYPERLAHSFGDADFVFTSCNVNTLSTDWKQVGDNKWTRTDEWGNIWGRVDPTSKGEVLEGVLKNIDDIDNYEFPDYSNLNDYIQPVKTIINHHKDKWIVGTIPGFTFNIARKLFKLDKYFMHLLLEQDKISILHDKIDKMVIDMITNYAKAGVDSIMFWEDWGTQLSTLISPELWYKEFYPRTKRCCDVAHNYGIKVFMHSCGAISSIIPGLIDAGIDLLQFDQPTLHGIDTLASYQKNSKITFWCPVDIQKTLQTKDESLIRAEAKEMVKKLWNSKGGFIAGFYSDNESIGLEPKWQEIACDEFCKQGNIN